MGDDDTGNSLLAELESPGVNAMYPPLHAGQVSSQPAIMQDAKGERIIVTCPQPDLLPDATLNDIDFRRDVALADALARRRKQAFTLARQAGVMTVLYGDITPLATDISWRWWR